VKKEVTELRRDCRMEKGKKKEGKKLCFKQTATRSPAKRARGVISISQERRRLLIGKTAYTASQKDALIKLEEGVLSWGLNGGCSSLPFLRFQTYCQAEGRKVSYPCFPLGKAAFLVVILTLGCT